MQEFWLIRSLRIASTNSIVEVHKKLAEAQDANCQQLLKAAKPTFLDNAKSNVLAGGVGGVLAVVAILLL